MNSFASWENHYTRQKSALAYPDENLVRMLTPWLASKDTKALRALDLGCGSGRHLALLADSGIEEIIGSDVSINALSIAASFGSQLVHCDNRALPFHDGSFDLVVCWGALHYGDKTSFARQVSEIHRIIKPGGALFATLRSDRDTMMRAGKDLGNNVWVTDLSDIAHSVVSFYSKEELTKGFDSFAALEYGIMERTPIGKIDQRISHWYFRADR
jgi:SAM-dependent methyltransferase